MPGAKYDVPPGPFGGSEGYAWSPDGRELAYTAKDQGRADAMVDRRQRLHDPASGGAPTVITAANKGADQNPVYSPDGKFIAYASQARAGFESDRWRLMLYDRAGQDVARAAADVGSQRRRVLLRARHERDLRADDRRGPRQALSRRLDQAPASAQARRAAARRRRSQQHGVRAVAATDARSPGCATRRESPGRGVRGDADGDGAAATAHSVTHENDALVAQLAVNPAEDFWFTGAAGVKVQGFIVKPPNWQAGQEISGDPAHSRRTAGRVARPMARPLELPDVRGDRRGARHHQSARLDRLRPEVRRRHVEGLGRQGLHRSDERVSTPRSRRIRGSTRTRSAPRADRSAATW